MLEFLKQFIMSDKRTSTITRHELELGEGTRRFLEGLVKPDTSVGQKLETIITAINSLDGKVDIMSSNIERIEKEAADAAENVGLVRTAIETLTTTVTDLKVVVTDLQQQVAQGQLDQSRLAAAAATLEKADEDMDALTLPPAGGGGETPPDGGGTEG